MEIENRCGDGIAGEMIAETDDTQIIGVSRMITVDSVPWSGKVVTAAVDAKAEGKIGEVEIENRSGDGIDCQAIAATEDLQLVRVSPMLTVDSISGNGEVVTAAVDTEVKAELKVDGVIAEVTVDEGSVSKRKRGRPASGQPSRGQPRPPPMKKMKDEEEDVCFICFDGGSLVLCDRRGCPKAYHPACIKRDEAFFRSKAKWNCGWHICSICQKAAAHYMCYTCTYSLCKACSKEADYTCVRENKGFCTICMRTIMLIEDNDQGNKEMPRVDFDDKSSWEYLFKVYWIYLKEKLSLTLHELTQAKNPWKAASIVACKLSLNIHYGVNDSNGSVFNSPVGHPESNDSKRAAEESKLPNNGATLTTDKSTRDEDTTSNETTNWASKDLLEFVSHMKNGDTSVLSKFDVQSLLLDYIKRNNLRDPSRKSQIICDLRLKNLFGKHRVGHFEMLKLVEFHFHTKDDIRKYVIEDNIIDAGLSQVEFGGNNATSLMMRKDNKRKNRTRGEGRGPQINLDEYAAINVHNINLIYLRRNLVESLVVDSEKFNEKVVGSIARIRISNNDQKQDMYRLVQVVGTSRAAVPYKIGEKTADVVLEILNLDKKETISIDAISNQALSEDECRRLRQSIKCGLVKRLTIGQVQKKAVALQEVRLDDWLETEVLRLNHLRDRASEKGHKKGLRECIEKLELLKTPEERQRRLHEIPEVHADPNMNPNCDSDEDVGEVDNKKQDAGEHVKPRFSVFDRKSCGSISAQKCDSENSSGTGAWKGLTTCGKSRILSTRFYLENGGASTVVQRVHDSCYEGKDLCRSNSLKKPDNEVDSSCSVVGDWNNQRAVMKPGSTSGRAPETSISSFFAYDSETEKLWHYRDPNGKIQGPFCMVQLRKWSTTGYFPPEMRIWSSTNNKEFDSVLLTDVLNGKFHKVFPLWSNISLPSHGVTASGNRLDYCDYTNSSSNMNTTGIDGKQGWNSSKVPDPSNFINEFVKPDGRTSQFSNCAAPVSKTDGHTGVSQFLDLRKINNDNLGQAVKAQPSLPLSLPVQVSGLHKLPSLTPELTSYGDEKADSNIQNMPLDGNKKIESAEDKLADSSKFPVQDSGSSWSTASSSLVVGGEKSPTHTKHSTQEGGDSGLGSVTWLASDHAAATTPTSKCDQLNTPPSPKCDQFTPPPPSGERRCEISDEWGGCSSSTHAKPSVEEEGDPVLGSATRLKTPELANDRTDTTTPTSKCDQINTPPSPSVERRCHETADEWGGCSTTRAKPSVEEEGDSGPGSVTSLKLPDHADIQTSKHDQLTPPSPKCDLLTPSPSYPASNESTWHLEPIEFSTLDEESVSDLLAEVDAMESQCGLAASPPCSAMYSSDDDELFEDPNTDWFTSLGILIRPFDSGKSDTMSSTGDILVPHQSTMAADETLVPSQSRVCDLVNRRYSVQPSTSFEGNNTD